MPTLQAAPTQTSAQGGRGLIVLGLVWATLFLLQFGIVPATLDFDMFHQMALARTLVSTGHFPLHDSFAYTPTLDPVIHHEWGMGLLLYAVSLHGGLVGLYMLLLALVAGSMAACIATARRGGAKWPAIILCALVVGPLGIVGNGAIRAQFMTVLFMAILLWMLESDRRGGRAWMAGWLVVFVAWSNLHGGFLVGLGVLGLYWIETAVRGRRWHAHVLLLILVSVAVSGISPYGYAHVASAVAGVVMARPIIPEWKPLWTEPIRFTAFIISLVPLVYCLRKQPWKRLAGLPLVIVCGVLALRHQRHSSLYAVAWFSYVPAWLAATSADGALDAIWMRRARLLAPVFLAFTIILVVPMIVRGEFRVVMPAEPAEVARHSNVAYPVGPVAYLAQQHFAGKVMTPFEMGAFVSWKLAPAVKVSMDSRYEAAYSPALAAEMIDFYAGDSTWRGTLERYPPDLVLARNSSGVASRLGAGVGWRRVYIDDVYAVYARAGIDLPVVDRTGVPLRGDFP